MKPLFYGFAIGSMIVWWFSSDPLYLIVFALLLIAAALEDE